MGHNTSGLEPGSYAERAADWNAHGWTPLPNALIRNPTIGSVAVRIYAWLASHTGTFHFRADDVSAAIPESRDKIRAGFRELEAAGWLTRTRLHDARGRLTVTHYQLHAMPIPEENRRSAPAPARPALGATSDGTSRRWSDQRKHAITAGRTSDGTSRASYKEEKNREKNTPLPPTVDETAVPGDGRGGTADDDQADDDATAALPPVLADAVMAAGRDRPDWTRDRIKDAVVACLAAGRSAELVAVALGMVARDASTRVPGRLQQDGDWWAAAARRVSEAERRRARQAERPAAGPAAGPRVATAAEVVALRQRPFCGQHRFMRLLPGTDRCHACN